MPPVDTNLHNGILTITLSDETNKNALSRKLVGGFLDAIDAAEQNPDVRVVVVTNTGRVFCAGADLKDKPGSGDGEFNPVDIFRRVRQSPLPFVGRIVGHCSGGGVGLAAAMDISVAVEWAKFGFTEVRLGVAPAMISVICLPKMSAATASELMLRGAKFEAGQAVGYGLINYSVAESALDATVDGIVADVVRGGPNALAATKKLINEVPMMTPDQAWPHTASVSMGLFGAPEAGEGIAAFLEKRDPNWIPQ